MPRVKRRPRVGISRCLVGDEVRYDGGHKRNANLIDTIGSLVEWVPVCPEVEAGMSTPREPIRLVADVDGVRSSAPGYDCSESRAGTDRTAMMVTFSTLRVKALVDQQLDGYVLKADSSSCAFLGVRVQDRERVEASGRGLFAEGLPRHSGSTDCRQTQSG